MTFAIAVATGTYTALVTDRRISADGIVHSDEYGKSGVVDFIDGRFAYSFTGLARSRDGKFDAQEWLVRALLEAGKPDGRAKNAIRRFAELAQTRFSELKEARRDLRFSLILAGYVDSAFGLRASQMYFVSNWESYDGSRSDSEASEKFTVEGESIGSGIGVVRAIGSGNAAPLEGSRLKFLVEQGVHPRAVVEEALTLIRVAAAHPKTQGTIGTHCSSIVLSPLAQSAVSSGYHVDGVSDVYYSPAYVYARYDEGGAWMAYRHQFSGTDIDGAPLTIVTGKIAKNAPCPCGSGDKYGRCHGSVKPPSGTELSGSLYFMVARFPEGDGTANILSARAHRANGNIDGFAIGPIDGRRDW